MTSTSTDPGRDTAAPQSSPSPQDKPAPARLSLTQVVASALAAVSATVLMSFFGIAGTIIGAGVASVVTVVGNYLYTRSIEKTHAQLKPVMGKVAQATTPSRGRTGARTTAVRTAGGPVALDDEQTVQLAAARVDALVDAGAGGGEDADFSGGDPGESTGSDESGRERSAWLQFVDKHGKAKVLTASALALFAVVMGVVLAVELVIGKPMSDAVRGQEGSGTSISHTVGSDGRTGDDSGTSPAEDPAHVPGDDDSTSDGSTSDSEQKSSDGESTDQGTDGTDGSEATAGTTDEPSSDPTEGTDSDTDGGTDGGTTDGSATDDDSAADDSDTTDDSTTDDSTTDGSTTDGGTTGSDTGTTDGAGSTGTSDGAAGTGVGGTSNSSAPGTTPTP